MLRRAVVGFLKGMLLGGLLAALLFQGLGVAVFPGVVVAYAMAGLTGALAGLVAGKPVWARGAAVEAALKAGFGAVLGAIALLVINKTLNFSLDLGPLGAGSVGQLPALALPLVGAVLAGIFELDNTAEDTGDVGRSGAAKPRVGEHAELGEVDHHGAVGDADSVAPGSERSTREGRR